MPGAARAAGASGRRPEPVGALIDRLSVLLVRSGRVLDAWDRWRAAREHRPPGGSAAEQAWTELPGDVAKYADLQRHKRRRRASLPPQDRVWCPWYDALDDLTFSVRRWRGALEAARAGCPGVAAWTDGPGAAPLERWTRELAGELNGMGGRRAAAGGPRRRRGREALVPGPGPVTRPAGAGAARSAPWRAAGSW